MGYSSVGRESGMEVRLGKLRSAWYGGNFWVFWVRFLHIFGSIFWVFFVANQRGMVVYDGVAEVDEVSKGWLWQRWVQHGIYGLWQRWVLCKF